jgi:hypothetical protein
MTSHKPLKSVSHNFGHSFISLMNYIHDDYFLGHLLKQARSTNLSKLSVDILAGSAFPKELLTLPMLNSINHWCKWFPELVNISGSTMDYVAKATMTIEFDLTKTRPFPQDNQFIENPFVCEIIITDDRGKEYRHEHTGWWFPQTL